MNSTSVPGTWVCPKIRYLKFSGPFDIFRKNSSLGVNPLFGQTQAACLKASMLSEGHGAHFWAKKAKRPVPKVQRITRSIDVAAVAVIKKCLSVH